MINFMFYALVLMVVGLFFSFPFLIGESFYNNISSDTKEKYPKIFKLIRIFCILTFPTIGIFFVLLIILDIIFKPIKYIIEVIVGKEHDL